MPSSRTECNGENSMVDNGGEQTPMDQAPSSDQAPSAEVPEPRAAASRLRLSVLKVMPNSQSLDSMQRSMAATLAKDLAGEEEEPATEPVSQFESYGFAGEHSRVHFEFRARWTAQEKLASLLAVEAGIVISGLACGGLAAAMNL
eukprot:6973979-Prymnesium_polylepis.1